MSGAAIDRLLLVYTSAYKDHVRAGSSAALARSLAREACDDFTGYVRSRRETEDPEIEQ